MNQTEFDAVVAAFQKAVKSGVNVEGECNALGHKMGSVEFGVDTSKAKTALAKAMNAAGSQAEPDTEPETEAPVESEATAEVPSNMTATQAEGAQIPADMTASQAEVKEGE